MSPDDANDITITLGVVIGPRMAPITVMTVIASSLINNQKPRVILSDGYLPVDSPRVKYAGRIMYP